MRKEVRGGAWRKRETDIVHISPLGWRFRQRRKASFLAHPFLLRCQYYWRQTRSNGFRLDPIYLCQLPFNPNKTFSASVRGELNFSQIAVCCVVDFRALFWSSLVRGKSPKWAIGLQLELNGRMNRTKSGLKKPGIVCRSFTYLRLELIIQVKFFALPLLVCNVSLELDSSLIKVFANTSRVMEKERERIYYFY